jgi:hypothetical protein
MNKVIAKDIAIRALKTFVQALLATFSLGLATANDATALKALAVASLSAGISAVWNTIVLNKKS